MKRLLFATLMALALGGPARSATGSDLLFAAGIFADLPDGQVILYAHDRNGPQVADFKPLSAGKMTLVTVAAVGAARERGLTLTMEAAGKQRQVVDFPVSGGNPVLMVFLESTVRSMAAIAGGSPFYIRNRIKDALRGGGAVQAGERDFGGQRIAVQEVTLRPFADDPNRARMGEFADLTLRFVVSDAVPGHFIHLSAETPVPTTGYHEVIALSPEEAAK
ncbi:MAG: hypothetical protein U1D06_06085 [Paracoccaceae bacterium]|nr:hypothetical protein [Paracoccaceae bacterium]